MKKLNQSKIILLIASILLIILGIAILRHSIISTLLSVVFLGSLLTLAGIVEIFRSFKLRSASKIFLNFALGALYTISGIFIISKPQLNAFYLTLFIAFTVVASGIVKILDAFGHEKDHQIWRILSGFISIIIGILIIMQWPYSGLWFLGTILGVEVLFTGFTYTIVALIN